MKVLKVVLECPKCVSITISYISFKEIYIHVRIFEYITVTPTSAIMGAGLGQDVALLTDGRFSGGSHVSCEINK